MKKPVHILTTLIILICLSIQVQAQTITTIVGNGTSGYSGDGGPATAAKINVVQGVVRFYAGNLYIADDGNNRIRMVNPFTGIITTIAGGGSSLGDGGPATAAMLTGPGLIYIDNIGNIYIGDHGAYRIRKIDYATGIITTIAGTGTVGDTGDGGPATAAKINAPIGIAMDNAGNLIFSDYGAYIRKIDTSGIITTIAGTGISGFSGDGGPASAANIYPNGICIDASGNIYIAEALNYCIRKINTSGIISRIAGIGIGGFAGDGGPASAATLGSPFDIVLDKSGNLFFSDLSSNRIREINTSGIISTVAGGGTTGLGDGGPATAAELNSPSGVDVDCAGNIYIGDLNNYRVREVNYNLNHPPHFINGPSQNITLCQCSGAMSLNSLLKVSDTDTAQMEWWVAYSGPIHGTLSGFTASGVSTGDTISPSGLTYTPPCTTYYAKDTFQIGIADCAGGTSIINVYVTVNPTPVAITGSSTVCLGTTTTFTDSTSGGAWTSSNTSIATVGSGTGVVTGVDTGAATITYTLVAGCMVTKTVTVIAAPPSISGITHVCIGSTTTLSDGTTGGAWASSTPTIATIGSGTGIVTGVAAGTATITYGFPSTGCRTTIIVTVNPLPLAITGTLNVCTGSNITLSDGTGGGVWSSGNISVATIGSVSGVVSGVSAGTATISYTLGTGCMVTTIVTVNPTPAGITGIANVCVGLTTTLSDGTTGGAWASGSPGIASVGSGTGIVTGATVGTATIAYGLPTGCKTTTIVTVNPLPAAITGNSPVCVGATITLGDPNAGGTWTSGSTVIASIGSGSGVVTGVATGTTTITYTLSTGCAITTVVTVSISPATITGTMNVCVGSTTTLSDGTGSGIWTSSNTAIATVGSSSGVVTGVAAGTATITYTIPDGCFAITTVTVESPATITGTMTVCAGSTTTLSDATGGGTWSSSTTIVATIGSTTGIVTGVTAGTTTITYTAGCIATATVTVNAAPNVITGTANVCVGLTTTLSDATTGGTWTSSNTAIATVGSASGIVTGATAGTATISYTLPDGCYSIVIVTVNPLPVAITGTTNVCIGFTVTLSDATTGGTWSSGSTAAVIGSSSGVVTGIAAGTAIITYTLSTGCITTYSITVDTLPAPITGITGICTDSPTHLYDATGTGTWSSSNTAIVTVGSSSGIVTTVALGTAVITYTIAAGCYVTTTVSPLSISGLHNMCAFEDSLTAISVPGGLFSAGLVTVVNLGGGLGEVHANAPGLGTVTYTLPNGCFVTGTLTVNPLPKLITGTGWICSGSTITLSDSVTGGSWSSDSTSIATVGSTTGIVTGVSTGIAVISYTLPTGCWADTSVVVNPLPTAIGGNSFLCIGSTINLTDGYPTGTWTSSNTTVATVGSTSGIVTGHAYGIDTLTYTLCTHSVTTVVTVSPLPPITGANTLCADSTTTLSDVAIGGQWSSSNIAIATIGSTSGLVTGVSGGSVTITYTLATGCKVFFPMQVNGGSGSCTPCSVFGAYTSLGTSGHITGNVGPGNYYIGNNVTVTGTDTFTNAIILIASYDTVFIDTSAILTLDSTHMFSLCTEWQGMALKPGHTHSGRLYVTNNSLIEDAMCAVYIPNAVAPSSGFIFKSETAIFNQNAVGVFIQQYTPNMPIYPFLFHNTVFTSRDFKTTNPNFPKQWPPVLGTGGLKNYYHTDTFSAPYNINKPTDAGLGYAYAGVYCYGSIVPTDGIRLDSVGMSIPDTSRFTGVGIPTQYNEIVIGDATTTSGNVNQNLFDHLKYGIYGINSNITSLNNAFTNMFATIPEVLPSGIVDNPGGVGIYVGETDDVANENRLRVYTPAGTGYKNLFYDFNCGVECSNYFQVIGDSTYMINKSFAALGSPSSGTGGYSIKTAKYDTIDITGNTITNVVTGVAMWMAYDPTVMALHGGTVITFPSQYMGLCNINGNLIQAHPDWTATLTNQQVSQGITFQNPIIYTTRFSAYDYINSLNINENIIHDAYDGIYVNHYWNGLQKPFTQGNNIYVRPNPARAMHLQYGINYTHCLDGVIGYNNVQGHMPPATTVNPESVDSIKAYYLSGWNSLANVGCWNTAQNTGRGFEFFLTNLYTNWHDNTMENNGKGMVLNGAVISPQVNGGTTTAPKDMHNTWVGAWSASNPQTYVIAGSAGSSWFCAYSSDAPIVNGGTVGTPFLYGAPGTIVAPAAPAPECYPITSPPPMSDTGNSFILMAQQLISFGTAVMPSNWMGQYSLWKTMVMDTAIADSSAALREFATLAATSRYKYLTDIETALSIGDLTTANSLLTLNIDSMADTSWDTVTQVRMADGTAADYIIRNYQQLYSIYIDYVTAAMTSADSLNILALAQLCPEINGGVVFQARALYSDIYNDLSAFNDDSCLTIDTTYFASRHAASGNAPTSSTQRYSLFPNPNDGSFTLQQLIPDEQPVKVEIWNAIGMTVYNDELYFNAGTDKLHIMNGASGLYLLRFTDCKNRQFILKFVVQ